MRSLYVAIIELPGMNGVRVTRGESTADVLRQISSGTPGNLAADTEMRLYVAPIEKALLAVGDETKANIEVAKRHFLERERAEELQ